MPEKLYAMQCLNMHTFALELTAGELKNLIAGNTIPCPVKGKDTGAGEDICNAKATLIKINDKAVQL